MGEHNSLSSIYSQMFTDYPDVVNVEQMCEMLGGIAVKAGYRLLKSNQIRHKRIGRVYRIPKAYILKYLAQADEQDFLPADNID